MLLLLLLTAAAAQETIGLRPGEAFFNTAGGSQRTTVLAPGVELGGEVVALLRGTASEDACAAACRESAECGWFNWCQEGEACLLPSRNATLAPLDCQLLAGNCTLVPPVAARSGNTTSGEGRHEGRKQPAGAWAVWWHGRRPQCSAASCACS